MSVFSCTLSCTSSLFAENSSIFGLSFVMTVYAKGCKLLSITVVYISRKAHHLHQFGVSFYPQLVSESNLLHFLELNYCINYPKSCYGWYTH